MATMKTVEFRCPYCNKKISTIPSKDYFAINSRIYGEPFETCKKCGKVYRSPFTIEPASAVTLRERVPLWITSVRFMVSILMMVVLSITFTYGLGLIVVAPFYLAVSALSRNYRQQHKNQLLIQSRERLKNPDYFMRHLLSSVYLPDKRMLTPQAFSMIHYKAQRMMDADQALNEPNLTLIVHSVIV